MTITDHLFSGSALGSVDAAGSVLLPALVLSIVHRRHAGNVLLVGPHDSDPCLTGYDAGYARILHIDHERRRLLEDGGAAQISRARRVFGRTEETAFAPSGRIVLPPMLRRKARIEVLALFVGAGGNFEIWNPALALESGDEVLRELAAWRLEDLPIAC